MGIDSTSDPAHDEMRVLLLPPTSRDAAALGKIFSAEGIGFSIQASLVDLCAAMARGAGAVMLSEEALLSEPDLLVACVKAQPVWSDTPIIVLSRAGAESSKLAGLLNRLGNISVLERPLRVSTLVSIIRSALRARQRQYQVRAYLADQQRAELELRASEQRLQLAVRTGKMGLWEVDLQTSEMTCTAIFKQNFGRLPEDPFTYEALRAAIHPDDVDRVRAAVRTAIERQVESDTEYRNIWPDGAIHWVLMRGHAESLPDGTPHRLSGVTLDITDRKTDEERRALLLEAERHARMQAEQAGQMKDEFLATLGHELRTPLNAILGWAQILRGDSSNADDVLEGLNVIERNARAQTQIIDDLLDMSRIISGKVRLNAQAIDLASVVEAAVATVKPAAEARGIRLQSVLDTTSGPVWGDPSRLQQVFWNLLNNSVKFSRRDGRVQVLLQKVNSHLEVRVIDEGEGIKPEFLPYVFERFRQADGTMTRQHGGLGLGLSIVKQLVELHGGRVEAASAGEGCGATFKVFLPLTAAIVPTEDEPSQLTSTPRLNLVTPGTYEKLAGLRVLVIDDEADARGLVKRLLETHHAAVISAGSAAEAMKLFLEHPVDVIVSDIGMPGEDGQAFIRKIRQLPESKGGRVPAVALTAYARSEDRTRALMAGFQSHIAKPVEATELLVTIAGFVRGTAAAPRVAHTRQ